MSVFHLPMHADTFSAARTAHWLRRIALFLDQLTGPAVEHWQAIPDWIIEYFALPEVPNKIDKSDYAGRRKWMTQYVATLEMPDPQPSGHLWQNITWLAERLALNTDEITLVTFSVCAFEHHPLRHLMADIDCNGVTDAYRKLALILDLPEQRIRHALRGDSKLARLGFIEHHRSVHSLQQMIDPGEILTETLCIPHASAEALFAQFATPAPTTDLTAIDFRHLNVEWDMLARTLEAAVLSKASGCNILLYGVPGSGKTELSRVLAKELGFSLYGVGSENITGETATGNARIGAHQLAQATLENHGKAVLVFDEAEDVFVHEAFLHSESSSIDYCKAYLNRILENNPVPTIWICNDTCQIDPAYRRRFDVVLRMNQLPYATRLQLVADKLDKYQLSAELQDELANLPNLLPYHIEKLDKLLRRAQPASNTELNYADNVAPEMETPSAISADQLAGLWLRENAALFESERSTFRHYANGTSGIFNAYQLPFDFDKLALPPTERVWLTNLLNSHTAPDCAMLIGGPHGAGKSEFAQQIGMHFNLPVVTRTFADFVRSEPGETERNLRKTFQIAGEEDVILLLEDIDTYRDRCAALDWGGHGLYQNSLRTLTTCLTAHRGWVIATAREPASLDAKLAQRFGCRFTLGHFSTEQNHALFEELCGVAAFQDRPLLKASLDTLQLVPLDYVLALQRLRMHAMGLAEAADEAEDVLHIRPDPQHRIDARLLLHHLKVAMTTRMTFPA